jgi:hypothetical protein
VNVDGKFIGYGVGDVSPECEKVNHRLIAAYPKVSAALQLGVTDTTLFTQNTAASLIQLVTFMNSDPASQNAARARGAKLPMRVDGVADLNVRKGIGAYTPPPPVVHTVDPQSLIVSVNGAGSTYNMGYPYDVAEAIQLDPQGNPLPPDQRIYYHQPIGYDTGQVPMMKHVLNSGVPEVIRQMDMPRPNFGGANCTEIPWQGIFYSMGALVGMTFLMRVLFGDLTRFRSTYMGSSAFGNPMRQNSHTYPGGIAVDGEGIVTPLAHDTPDCHWDFVSAEGMVNSKGDDLYARVGSTSQFWEDNPLTVKDMRAVWQIVSTGNPLTLFEQIGELVLSPSFSKAQGAAGAAYNAAKFFIAQGITPHTTYQFVQTRDGDDRSAWDQALWHARDLAFNRPLPYAKAGL